MTVERNDREQRLRWGHYAPDRVHGELLHHAIDRCRERLELGSSLGLDHVLSKAGGLLLGLGQLLRSGAAVLRGGLSAGLDEGGNRGFGFVYVALLDHELLLKTDEVLELGEILEFRTIFLGNQVFANVDTLRHYRNCCLDLGDRGGGGSALSLLLRHLAIERRELSLLFGRLTDQELAVHLDQRRARALGRANPLERIARSTRRARQSA